MCELFNKRFSIYLHKDTMSCVTTYEDVWYRVFGLLEPIEMIPIQFVNTGLNGYVKKNYGFINNFNFLIGYVEGESIKTQQDYINHIELRLIKNEKFYINEQVIHKYNPYKTNDTIFMTKIRIVFVCHLVRKYKYKLDTKGILNKLADNDKPSPGEQILLGMITRKEI